MTEENIKVWGPFADLALMWCEAFMDDNDYFILMIYFQKRKWTLHHDELQNAIQSYEKIMILSEMRLAAMNLQSFGIVCLDETKTNNYQKENNFKNMTINVDFVECFDRQWRFLDEKCKIDKQEVEKQLRCMSNKKCNVCGKLYSLQEIHLDVLKRCKRPGCEDSRLEDFQVDETKKKHVQVLEKILEKIRLMIELCRKEPFPRKDDIEQTKKIDLEIIEKKFLDAEVEKYWNEQKLKAIHKIFKLSIRKKIDLYVQRKQKIISNKMIIE